MEKDLTSLLAERDAQIHKMELEKLRDENRHLLEQIRVKIENAKSEITESAITKTMHVLDKTRLWLVYGSGIFAVFIAVAGIVGYKSVNKELTDYYINTVHHWLRFDSEDSGGSKALNDLRTSALLDSLTLKYERDRSMSGPIPTLNLTPEARQRLMALILDPSTDEHQYYDALRLIMINRGIFGRFSEDDTGKKIASILSNKDFSDAKRLDVLNVMAKDRALYPWALAVINEDNSITDEDILMSAFRNVALFNKERALIFARKNIKEFRGDTNKVELGVFLIKNDVDEVEISNLIESLKNNKSDQLVNLSGRLIIEKIKHGFDAKNNSLAVKYMSEQIDSGLKLELNSYFDKKPVVSFSLDGAAYPFREPEKLFDNKEVIDGFFKRKPLNYDHLIKLTSFFQLQDRGYWITTLMFKPVKETEIIIDKNNKVSGDDILQNVWLRSEKQAGKMTLSASWRAKDGTLKNSPIVSINGCKSCHFFIDFNHEQLRSYTWIPDYDYLDD